MYSGEMLARGSKVEVTKSKHEVRTKEMNNAISSLPFSANCLAMKEETQVRSKQSSKPLHTFPFSIPNV